MVRRVRLGVRNQQSGRIAGFVYCDLESWNRSELLITAVDDGKKLITGLYVPHISASRSLLQVLFGCKYPKIDFTRGSLSDF
ncbi:hypothetical protein [uncultured Nostoc sp.]|uniref:hypothetical protein n=1 Tax=uncultured Nostoc sp. TaxID=340711 RepID=UPI0035CBAF32